MTYTDQLNTILRLARQEAQRLGNSFVEPEHLLLGILRAEEGEAYHLLSEAGVDTVQMKIALDDRLRDTASGPQTEIPFSRTTERILRLTAIEAGYYDSTRPDSEHLLLAVLHERLNFPSVWLEQHYAVTYESIEKMHPRPQAATQSRKTEAETDGDNESFVRSGQSERPEGHREMSVLQEFGLDLTMMARDNMLGPVYGREEETERIIQILQRHKKNNPILIGDPGVGKSAIIEGLAQRIARDSVPSLAGKEIVAIDMGSMVAGTSYRGQFEERMENLIDELRNHRNTILFIDEIHTIIGAGNSPGNLDAANILKPALARGEICCIGATTAEEYRKSIARDGALERRFQTVNVRPNTPEETYQILLATRETYSRHHHAVYPDESLRACVALSERYLTGRAFPDKALDVVDEAGARKAALHGKQGKPADITPQDIATVVSLMSGVPVTQLAAPESRRLLNMDQALLREVIGQDEAVHKVVRAIRRSRLGLQDPQRPIGTFLFLGPTGVGKTWLARCLAKEMFGTEDALIRFDMSEYMEKHTLSLLVGAPPGYVAYEEGGKLTEAVHRRPYSVVLFDEIEKAHPDIFNILLQVMDEGRLTDRQGRQTDFRHTVIILTSNAGTRQLRDFGNGIGFQAEALSEQQSDRTLHKALQRTFPPEFTNRIDDVVIFHALDRQTVEKIIDREIQLLKKRMKAAGHRLTVAPEVQTALLEKAFDPQNGARPVRRAVQTWIEDPLAARLLKNPKQKTIRINTLKQL